MALGKKNVAQGVNFGDADMYVAGGGLPEDDYLMRELNVELYQATTQAGVSRGPVRLGVMITFQSLTDREADERKQFYSMGTAASKSFAPNPDTGKGIVAIPGGPGQTLNNTTNWSMFRQSLEDSGLPKGIFTNDVSVLEGTWVHISNVPEPAERKGFVRGAATGEAGAEEVNRPGSVAVVSEILEGGSPWDNGGGEPEEAAAPAKAAKGKALAKPKSGRAAPKASEKSEEEAIKAAAINGIATVLEKYPDGCPKLIFRTQAFKAVGDSEGAEMAQAVVETYFATPEALELLLAEVSFTLDNGKVVPV